MNTADLLLIRHEDMHQRDIDYFGRKGCYDLAQAILLDCLQQLAHDCELKLPATRMEHQWLTGRSDHAPVSCVQVLTTLGMEPGGRLQHMFLRVALEDPSKAIRMLTSPQARQAFRAMDASACTDEDDLQSAGAGEDAHSRRSAKTTSQQASLCDSTFEPWVAPSTAQLETNGAHAPVSCAVAPAVLLSTVPRAVRVTALDPACPAGPDLLRYLTQGELFPTETAPTRLQRQEQALETALEHPGQYEDEEAAYDRSEWRMRAA
jgi:hypothetical protein